MHASYHNPILKQLRDQQVRFAPREKKIEQVNRAERLLAEGAADMVSMFIRGSLVPLATPDDQLGRVSAVEGVFIGASNELGAFESGVAARVFGLPWSIAAGGFITTLVAVSFAWLFPSLRQTDTFDEVRPEAKAPAPSPVSHDEH